MSLRACCTTEMGKPHTHGCENEWKDGLSVEAPKGAVSEIVCSKPWMGRPPHCGDDRCPHAHPYEGWSIPSMKSPDLLILDDPQRPDAINPAHYKQGGVEVIDAIEAWDLGFSTGNAIKYIARAGKKDPAKTVEDLEKARWYLNREIERLQKGG